MSGALPPTRDHGRAGTGIADVLRDEILRGVHPPGTRIRQEDLAARHTTSRLPVREALRLLESEGLVTLVANSGAWVSRLTLAECEELYLVRERIEPVLLGLSAPLLTPADLDELDGLADLMEGADAEEFLVHDRAFHLLTYAPARTVMLGDTVVGLWNRTHHYRRAFVAAAHARHDGAAHHDHRLLVAALRRGDAEEAAHVLERHIRRTRIELERHPEIFDADAALR
ncbi:GntR family transcriptional regulator [Microbacterium sp. KSW2-21]|uniref:GntR family transcriptional regulator n=1 Tax=Microbacterium algihabitans TaxID=3075992 RepID=A0ABU3S053_9MICO|nr:MULTISPECIES: GntR family transcriptional regulator [unclassified Microbacterium]MDU0328190.1 GntR family transcriptional regulator [Microbacterium sp. KSW2-21]